MRLGSFERNWRRNIYRIPELQNYSSPENFEPDIYLVARAVYDPVFRVFALRMARGTQMRTEAGRKA